MDRLDSADLVLDTVSGDGVDASNVDVARGPSTGSSCSEAVTARRTCKRERSHDHVETCIGIPVTSFLCWARELLLGNKCVFSFAHFAQATRP